MPPANRTRVYLFAFESAEESFDRPLLDRLSHYQCQQAASMQLDSRQRNRTRAKSSGRQFAAVALVVLIRFVVPLSHLESVPRRQCRPATLPAPTRPLGALSTLGPAGARTSIGRAINGSSYGMRESPHYRSNKISAR